MTDGNQLINPETLSPAIGFSHAVAANAGRTIYLAGQPALDSEGNVMGETWVEQFDLALANLVEALRSAGGSPSDLVWMQIFTTDVSAYRSARTELGPVYRRHLERHYPAMGLFGVTELVDPSAMVEITGIAVVPN